MTQLLLAEEKQGTYSRSALQRRWLVVLGGLIVQGAIVVAMVVGMRQPAAPAIVLAPMQGDATTCRIVSVAPFTDAWVFGIQPGERLYVGKSAVGQNAAGCHLTRLPLRVTLAGQNRHLLPPVLRPLTRFFPSPTITLASTEMHTLGATDFLLAAMLALVFDLAGMAILLRAQDRPLARITYALFYSTALIFCLISVNRYSYPWGAILIFLLSMLSRGLSTTFVCLFPYPMRTGTRQGRLTPYLPLAAGLLIGVTSLPFMLGSPAFRLPILLVVFVYNLACILIVTWMLVWGLRRLNRTEQHLARMILVGIIFLLVPLALSLNIFHADAAVGGGALHLIPIPLAVLPIISDYALFQRQLIGTTSLVSRRVMRVLLWILLASLFVFPCIILLHSLHSAGLLKGDSADYLFAALLVVCLCVFPLAWNKVRDAGDHVFYRDFYQYNRALRELSADLARVQRLDELQSHVLPRLASLLNTNDVALLVRASHDESATVSEAKWNVYHYAVGSSTPATLSKLTGLSGERLTGIANLALTHLAQPSYEPLLIDGVLLLALYAGASLRGFLCLGPKRNFEPYSRQDTSFLATLASHLAVLEVNHRYLVQAQADAHMLAALNRRVVSAQEEERKHLALDLHDEVLQQAMLLVRQLSDAGTMSDVADTMPLARSIVSSLRRTCLELRPPLLDELGLGDALAWLARQTEQRSNGAMQVRMIVEGTAQTRPAAEVELALYRVGQEALSNALKYSQASGIVMRLRYRANGGLSLLVHDNGRGFNRFRVRQGRVESLGLIGMYERMVSIGGTLQLRTSPGRGVTIRACYTPVPTFIPVEV